MIELPEAVTIARQITQALKGKRIESCIRGNAPHKFTWYTHPPEEYDAILRGKTIGDSWPSGGCIMVAVEPGYTLELGAGGERIRLHSDESTLPKRHQLLVAFCDGTYLSVTVQMWGSAKLLELGEPVGGCAHNAERPSPLGDTFTYAYFGGLLEAVPEGDPRSAKFALISDPGVWGLGNGYTHDILWYANLNPRTRVAQMTGDERRGLYNAVRRVLCEATDLGGRDSELDLYGSPGRYRPVLDRRAKGQPCPECGTLIESMSFLGGTSYYCPRCQSL